MAAACRSIAMSRPSACCQYCASGALRVVGSGEVLEPRDDEFDSTPSSQRVQSVALWFYRNYWRVEVDGIENVPARGRALLVANHAGVVLYDGAMIRTAIMAEHSHPRHALHVGRRLGVRDAFTNMLLVKTGNVLAHPDNATALLERDELVGVFPEGQGRGQALSGSLSHQAIGPWRVRPVSRCGLIADHPVAVVGSEELHPVMFDLQPLARPLWAAHRPDHTHVSWLGLAGLLPLPSKWFIAFGKLIDVSRFGPDGANDARLVLDGPRRSEAGSKALCRSSLRAGGRSLLGGSVPRDRCQTEPMLEDRPPAWPPFSSSSLAAARIKPCLRTDGSHGCGSTRRSSHRHGRSATCRGRRQLPQQVEDERSEHIHLDARRLEWDAAKAQGATAAYAAFFSDSTAHRTSLESNSSDISSATSYKLVVNFVIQFKTRRAPARATPLNRSSLQRITAGSGGALLSKELRRPDSEFHRVEYLDRKPIVLCRRVAEQSIHEHPRDPQYRHRHLQEGRARGERPHQIGVR